jgi:peptidoglycan/LPS O-acetylase OafA/YrhL
VPPLRDTAPLDGMRGIAALLVVGFHVVVFAEAVRVHLPPDPGAWAAPAAGYFLGWGFIGVDFFFVLSAFLLSQPFLADRPTQDIPSYAAKRLLRVLPAYYASLVLAWALLGRTGHPWFAMDWTEVWRHVTFTHGFWFESQLAVSAVYWTLAVELQFYLLLPLLVMPFRTRWWPLALVAASAITIVYRAWAFLPGDEFGTRFRELQLPAFLWHFAIGITAARFRQRLRDRALPPHRIDAMVLASVAAFIIAPGAVLGFDATRFGEASYAFTLAYRPLVAIGFTCVILLGCVGPSRTAAFFSSPPLKHLGDWSYSLYLTHYASGAWLVLALPTLFSLGLASLAFVAVVWSLVVAAAFYWVADRPVMRLKERLVDVLHARRGRIEPPPLR